MQNKFIFGLGIIGISIFSFTDLMISMTLASGDNPFGLFFRDYGEFPGYVILIISLLVQIKFSNDKRIVALNTILLLLFGAALYIRYSDANMLMLILLTVLTLTPFFILKLREEEYLIGSKRVIQFFLILPFLLVQSLKLLWGRIRFRDLDLNYSEFTPWYIPQGYNGNYSFPSGHTAMGIFLLGMNLYFRRKSLFWITLFWGVLVAISRVLIGAHYASDVWFSLIAGIMLYQWLYDQDFRG